MTTFFTLDIFFFTDFSELAAVPLISKPDTNVIPNNPHIGLAIRINFLVFPLQSSHFQEVISNLKSAITPLIV